METNASQRSAEGRLEEVPIEEMAAALERNGRFDELVRLCESRSTELSPELAGYWLLRAGELSRSRLKDLPRAEELLRQASRIAPQGSGALEALQAVLEQRQDPAALAEVLEQLAAERSGTEAAALWVKAADLYELKLHRKGRALLCCQRASRASPTDRALSRRVRALFLADRHLQSVFDSLESDRARFGGEGLAEEYLTLAKTLLDDPEQKALALEALTHAEALGAGAKAQALRTAIEQQPQTWRDRVKVLRQASLEERDRKEAARLSLSAARLQAAFDKDAAKVQTAVDRAFLLWPAMGEALDFLEARAKERPELEQLVRRIEQMAADTRDRAAQVELELRAGTVRLVRLQDASGAIICFERAANADPTRGEPLSLLAELFFDQDRPADAVAALERHLITLKDRAAKGALHARIAALCQVALHDDEKAQGHWEQVLELERGNAEAAFELARIKVAKREGTGLEPLLERASRAQRPVPDRLSLLDLASQVLSARNDPRGAFGALLRRVALAPDDLEALDRAVVVGHSAGFDVGERLQRAIVQGSDEAHERLAALLKQLPAAQEIPTLAPVPEAPGAAPEPPDAEAQARAALAANPADATLLETAAKALWSESKFEPLVAVTQALENASDEAARPRWTLLRARVLAEKLARPDEAVAALLPLCAKEPPADALTLLEKLAAEGVQPGAIADALAPHLGKAGAWQRLSTVLQQASAAAGGDGLKWLLARARVLEQKLVDPRGAFEAWLAAVRCDPDDATFVTEAWRLARELSSQAELGRALGTCAAEVTSEALQERLWTQAVDALEEGGAPDDAQAALEQVIAQAPHAEWALSRLVKLHLTAGRTSEGEQILRRRILSAEGEEKARLYLQLSALNADLERPREAAVALNEAIRAGADEATHLERLAQLWGKAGKSTEQGETLDRRLALATAAGDQDTVSRLSLERAQLLGGALGNRLEAVHGYAAILDHKPSDPEALAGLEQLLEDETCREEAARALLPAYEAIQDHRKLAAALDAVAMSTQDPLERVMSLKRAAQVHLNDLRQPELAFTTLARALKLAPADASLRSAARSAAEAADTMDTYAEVLEELAEQDLGALRVDFYRELSDVEEKKLAEPVRAIEHLKALLALSPTHLDALKALARLQRTRELWPELASTLEALAAAASGPEAVALWREAAQLCDQKLADPERAARAFGKLAELDPLDREAATGLDRLHGALEHPQEQAKAVALRIAQEGQSPQGRELSLRLAKLQREKLDDGAGALKTLAHILEEDPAHAGALELLEGWARSEAPRSQSALELLDPVLERSGDHARRVSIREARLGPALGEEKARLAGEIRELYEQALGQPDRAFLSAVQAFTQGTDREGVLPELSRLAKETGAQDELASVLEGVALDLPAEEPQAADYLKRAAQLREQLGEPEEAIRLWKELQTRAPQDGEALEGLSRLYERANNARSLSDVYAQQASLSQDPTERRDLLIKAGRAFEEAGEDGKAIEGFKAALAIAVGTDALEALDRLYAKAKQPEAQADVLSQLAAASEGEARQVHLVKRAQLLEREGDERRAVAAYQDVLQGAPTGPQAIAGLERLMQLDSTRTEAARTLEPVFRRMGDDRKLVETLEVLLAAESGERRLLLLKELASLRELLGQKPLALAARLRAFAETPQAPTVREELERLAAELGAFEELADAYEVELEKDPPEALAVELWRRLAVLYADRLDRPELAVRSNEELSRRNPKDPVVLEALAALHRRTKGLRELAQVMRRQVAAEPAVPKQIDRLNELARLAEDDLSDKALAAETYQAILERKGDDLEAIKQLDRVLTESERYPELAQLIEKEVALAEARHDEDEALSLRVRLGRLLVSRLSNPQGALKTFEEVLAKRPGHAGAVGALEELARSESPFRKQAAAVLEPIFAVGGDHLKLVQMLESRVSAEAAPQERSALLRKVAELYAGPMDNVEMAFVAAARALRESPDDEAALTLSIKLAGVAGTHEELQALLEECVTKAHDDKARVGLFRALARLRDEAGETVGAIDALKRVLAISPTDQTALGQLAALYQKANRPAELLEVLRRELALADAPDARAQLLLEIGTLQDEVLEDAIGALATLRRLLELKPNEPRALERMDALCVRQQRWPELAEVIGKRIAQTQGPDLHELKFRLAQIKEARLRDKASAIALWGEILSEDPGHAGAAGALEALLQKEPANGQAAQALLTAYRTGKNNQGLAELIEKRVAASPDRNERKSLLLELGKLRDDQHEPELGFLVYWRAFKEDPNDAALREQLERAAEQAEAFDELAAAYDEELPRIAERSDAAEVAFKLGQVLERHLDEKDRAVEMYERARELDPNEPTRRALSALERLYTELDKPEALATTLERLVEKSADVPEQIAQLLRLGSLANDRMGDPERAAGAYERVLELDGSQLVAARLLEPIYEQAGKNDKLYGVLQKQRELSQGAERERVLGKMAQVSAEGLSDLGHSIELLQEILAKNPRNEGALASLIDALEKAERYDELEKLLQTRVAATLDPRELVKLNDRLGRMVWKKLQRPEQALPYFKAALDRDARHKGALEAMRDIHEELGRQDDLVAVLRRLLPLQDSAEGVKALRIRVAEVLAGLGRREEALDAARRALEVEPHSVPDLDRVAKVFEGLRAFPDAARALELRVEVDLRLEERDQALKTLFELADLWRNVAGKPELAPKVLERILEIDPANKIAHEQVCALYVDHRDWRAYAAAIDRYLPHLVTDEEKLASLKDLAQVREDRLGQKDTALLALCRAIELDPSDAPVRQQVERLADETGSHDELAMVYESVADGLPRGPLAETLYLALARIQDEKLDDADEAEAALRKVLEFDPTNASALEALGNLFKRRGRDEDYVASLEQKLEAVGSLEQRKSILKELARVHDEAQRPQEATSAYLRALELEADPETLGQLGELYRRQGAFSELASVLARGRDLAGTNEERARYQLDIARVYELDVADDEAAIEAYGQALSIEPNLREALDALERLYTKLDRPAELLAVYEKQLDVATDDREKVSILFRSAAIWEDRYENRGHADACIEGVLAYDPENLQAVKTLERLRRAEGRWEELTQALERHLVLSQDPTEQAQLYVEEGDVLRAELRQVDRAANAYHAALNADPTCVAAVHALGELYERSGNWPFAIEMLQREAQLLGDSPEAVELYFRLGKIQEEMLGDLGSAKTAYQSAVRVDPAYLPAIRSLKSIHQAEQDWGAYEQAVQDEAQRTEDPEAKAKAYLEAGNYHAQREEQEAAVHAYEEAIRYSPELLEAALPLADAYTTGEQWEKSEAMLDVVCRKMAERAIATQDPQLARDLCRQLYRLGYVSEKLSRKDKALVAYEKAYQLDSTYLPALEGYSNLLVAVGRNEDALTVLQAILIHHREDLTDFEVVEIYWQLGEVQKKLNQHELAENHYTKALAIDPEHEPSLRALISLAEEGGRFDKAAEYRNSLVSVLQDEEKFQAAVELGKLAREKLNEPHMAIDAFVTAHKLDPDSLEVMDALYPLYRQTRQGHKAAEILERMLEQPQVTSKKEIARKVWFTLGEIARDELRELDRAIGAFNASLDVDPMFIEAFSAIEQLLGSQKQWKALEENYAKMIQRLPKGEATNPARLALWKALGDLYLKVLKQPEAARMAYQVVAAASPEDAAVQELYAELCAKTPGQEDAAIDAYRKAIARSLNPGKIGSALAELFAKKKDYDGAYLAALAVQATGTPLGEGEQEILSKLSGYAKRKEVAQKALTDRLWTSHLLHPKTRGPLGELLAILFEQAGHLYAVPHSQYQLNPKKHRIDVASAQEYQIHHYRYVARLLGLESVELFSPFLVATRERLAKRSGEPAPDTLVGVELCHTHPACLKVGGKYFGEPGQKEVYYLLGRTLAMLRPELALTQRLAPARLEAVIQAAVSLVIHSFRPTVRPEALEGERKLLEKALPEPGRAALGRVAAQYVKSVTPRTFTDFLEGAELTGLRAGFFVAGEVEPVRKMIQGETGAAFRVATPVKIRDLVGFAVSDDLKVLRTSVGVQVEISRN